MIPIIKTLACNNLASPLSVYHSIPLERRAAVAVLLFSNELSELCCILTIRSKNISYAGDSAFPGGKAEFESEEPHETALREAQEEIGTPANDSRLEHVCDFPCYLSSRYHAVVPSIFYLDSNAKLDHKTGVPKWAYQLPLSMEVSSVFGAPLASFLSRKNHKSFKVNWDGLTFQQHFFQQLARSKAVGEPGQIRIWGLTARILVDLAEMVYERKPDFVNREHRDSQGGDQRLIERMISCGHFEGRAPKRVDFRAMGVSDYRL